MEKVFKLSTAKRIVSSKWWSKWTNKEKEYHLLKALCKDLAIEFTGVVIYTYWMDELLEENISSKFRKKHGHSFDEWVWAEIRPNKLDKENILDLEYVLNNGGYWKLGGIEGFDWIPHI